MASQYIFLNRSGSAITSPAKGLRSPNPGTASRAADAPSSPYNKTPASPRVPETYIPSGLSGSVCSSQVASTLSVDTSTLQGVTVPHRTSSKDQQERRQVRQTTCAMSYSTVASPIGRSRANSECSSYETNATSLPALQVNGGLEEDESLEPVKEEDIDPGSFDLVAPVDSAVRQYSLETRSEQLFSTEHLKIIFGDPSLLLRFTAFLSSNRPSSVPVLIYYLDAVKALKAISYSNAIADALEPIKGCDFTVETSRPTANIELETKAKKAFEVMVREDLPAYVTHTYIQTVSLSIQRRITGTLPARLREASEGLAEVFCLTDPSRPDNPIVFASEEFHRTTQYGMSYVLGRNCRFLQGPKTNPFGVRRIREKIDSGEEHCEVFLNYRRDGSPFMNLLMIAPLYDSRGKIRYFIGAQVDVSGLVKECSDLESLKRLVVASEQVERRENIDGPMLDEELAEPVKKDELQELSEMLNMQELDTVRRWGGRMHREKPEEVYDGGVGSNWTKPRLLIHGCGSPNGNKCFPPTGRPSGKLSGIYENYLLVRPYPSLLILFASPSLRVPGILQSPFMAKVGGMPRVREELTHALAEGRSVTAKVSWVSRSDVEGRNRWIHCTPLVGSNGAIGVWMVVIVDDESDGPRPKFKQAPPVDPRFGRHFPAAKDGSASIRDCESLRGVGLENRRRDVSSGASPSRSLRPRSSNGNREGSVLDGSSWERGSPSVKSSKRSGSPHTLSLE